MLVCMFFTKIMIFMRLIKFACDEGADFSNGRNCLKQERITEAYFHHSQKKMYIP